MNQFSPFSEPWQPDEIRKYEAGKHRLSVMMGCQSLTEKEIEKTLHYLLPTRLTANDARPFLKVSRLSPWKPLC